MTKNHLGSFVGLLGVRNSVKRNLVLLTFRLPCLQVFAVQQITLVFTSYFEQTKYLRVFWKSKIIQKSSKNPVSVIAPSEGTTSLPSTRMGKLSLLPPPCVLIPSSVLPGHWPGKPRLQLTSYIIRYCSRCLLFAVCGGSVEEWRYCCKRFFLLQVKVLYCESFRLEGKRWGKISIVDQYFKSSLVK